MNKHSLWWYAHTEINKRWNAFNKAIVTEDMLMQKFSPFQFSWPVSGRVEEKIHNDIEIAWRENVECDKELRNHFITI